MSIAIPVIKASELSPDDVGKVVSFEATEDIKHTNGVQVGMAGRGSGRLLAYFVHEAEVGSYVALGIEGFAHQIAVGGDDPVTVHSS